MAHEVFISYASGDANTAREVCGRLESAGVRCWMAPRDIRPGMNWGEELIKAIEQSRGMLLLLSANANKSNQVVREVERAASKGLWIITFRLESVKPTPSLEFYVSSDQWLDAFDGPAGRHYAALTAAVKLLLDGAAAAPKPADGKEGARAAQAAPPSKVRWTLIWALVIAAAGVIIAGIPLLRRPDARRAFAAVHDKYVVEFLRRNPTTNTYLGGILLDKSLREVDGKLRDFSAPAIESEGRWLADSQRAFSSLDQTQLTSEQRVNRELALAQITFLLHQHQTRRYQERAVDAYVSEPFRAIDWQLQGMTQTGEKTYGTPEEWQLVARRLADIPRYLLVAQQQMLAGVKSGNTADWRMLRRDGVLTAEATAEYFKIKLPEIAKERMADDSWSGQLLREVSDSSRKAADAYVEFAGFIRETFFDAELKPKPQYANDRFSIGEAEYNWRLKNCLRINQTATELYESSFDPFAGVRNLIMIVARKIGARHHLTLPADDRQAVRAVFNELSKDYPKSDAEMVAWYREGAARLVAYGRTSGLFDVPAAYKLDVVETPPPLRAAIDGAAYYPAPPFRNSGVGRLYVTTSGDDDPAVLKENNRFAIADLLAHEGFPGHDWHYMVMTRFRNEIAGVRWLTPGAVEDSSSMWQDSMALEGWALYAEALLAKRQEDGTEGFYTPEEQLYQLQGELYRNLRVRVDTGLHTGRMTYDEAIDLFSETIDFLPGRCSDPNKSEAKRVSCEVAERAIFRYSKWPTQAITYSVGRDQIQALRENVSRVQGNRFSQRDFYLQLMKQGAVAVGFYEEEMLREAEESR